MSTEVIDLATGPAPGATKSFWGHIQDLRQTLIRCAIVIGLALLLCMTFADRLVTALEYPLRNIDLFEKAKPTVTLQIGSSRLGPYAVSREQFAALPAGTSPRAVFQVGTTQIGNEQVLTVKLLPDEPTGDLGPLKVHLHNFGPVEGFFVAFHVAFYGAMILSAPFWMYFIGSFIMPALHLRERQALFPWVGWSVALFFAGVLATFFILLPVALRASVEYSNLLGFEGYDWRADDYIGFVTHFILGMGLGFQFPIVVLALVKMGVLTYRQLAHYRRHVCVLSFILGAVLTTPEVITQVAMAIPLYLLYEVCIWVAWYWEWKKRRAATGSAG